MNALVEYLHIPDFPNAICATFNPELMTSDSKAEINFAKSICCKCTHKFECLEYAITGDEVGIWGGCDEEERAAMKSARIRLGAQIPKRMRAKRIDAGLPRGSKLSA